MVRGTRRASLAWGIAVYAGLGLTAGCTSDTTVGRAGVSLSPPEGWRPVPAETWRVPGTPLAAWRGPAGASLVVYKSLPAPGASPSTLAEAMAHRLENNPGLRVVGRRTEQVSGADAARLDVVAPGSGDAFAPTGKGDPVAPEGKTLIPTRRVVVIVTRPADTLTLLWHAPESEAGALEGGVRETLKSLAIGRGRLATSSY